MSKAVAKIVYREAQGSAATQSGKEKASPAFAGLAKSDSFDFTDISVAPLCPCPCPSPSCSRSEDWTFRSAVPPAATVAVVAAEQDVSQDEERARFGSPAVAVLLPAGSDFGSVAEPAESPVEALADDSVVPVGRSES